MALLATQEIGTAGVHDVLAAAAGGGDTFVPDRDVFIRVNNGGGSSITVTVATPGKTHGFDIADVSVAVPAGESRMIGGFPSDLFGDPANSRRASIAYSGVTSVTVGAFKLTTP